MIHHKDSAAVVRTGDIFTILLDADRGTVGDLRTVLAAVNSGAYVGDIPESVRQLLHDLEGALVLAFTPRKRVRDGLGAPGARRLIPRLPSES